MLPPVTQLHHTILQEPFPQSSSLPRSISVGKQIAEKGRQRSVQTHKASLQLLPEAGVERSKAEAVGSQLQGVVRPGYSLPLLWFPPFALANPARKWGARPS